MLAALADVILLHPGNMFSKMFQASSNMTERKAALWKFVPVLGTRTWDRLQMKVGVPHSFFPGLKVVKKLLDALMWNLSEAVLGNMKEANKYLYWSTGE